MYKFVIGIVTAITFAVPANADIAGAPSPVDPLQHSPLELHVWLSPVDGEL